jgi:hypothetical protein
MERIPAMRQPVKNKLASLFFLHQARGFQFLNVFGDGVLRQRKGIHDLTDAQRGLCLHEYGYDP